MRLVFEFEAIHEKEHAMRVFGADEQLGDGRAEQRLAGAGSHLEKETVAAFRIALLQRRNRRELIVAQEADFLIEHRILALRRAVAQPCGILRNSDVVFIDDGRAELLRVGIPADRLAELLETEQVRDARGIVASAKIPVVVNLSVRENDMPHAEAMRVVAGLFFSIKRMNAFPLRLDDRNGPVLVIQQQVIDEATGRFLKVVAEVHVGCHCTPRRPMLADDVGRSFRGRKKRHFASSSILLMRIRACASRCDMERRTYQPSHARARNYAENYCLIAVLIDAGGGAFTDGHAARKQRVGKTLTVVAISMGLLLLLWDTGAGADTMRRLVVPLIGGLTTSFPARVVPLSRDLLPREAPEPSPRRTVRASCIARRGIRIDGQCGRKN